MNYGRMPLFPGCSNGQSSVRVPLFCGNTCACPKEDCQCVRIRNPACPTEYADVELCVDADGNLSVCVRRPTQDCSCAPCRRRRPSCDCSPWFR